MNKFYARFFYEIKTEHLCTKHMTKSYVKFKKSKKKNKSKIVAEATKVDARTYMPHLDSLER